MFAHFRWLATVALAGTVPVHLLAPTARLTPPPPWVIAVKEGKPVLRTLTSDGFSGVCLDSTASSFAIQRATAVDLARTPILHLRWRADALPPAADFRTRKDDQAAQFFVAFATPLRYRAINYIWDTTAPLGAVGDYDLLWFIKIKTVVVQSGDQETGRWIEVQRDVRQDYETFFGGSAPIVRGVRFQVNSQHTKSHAVGCVADVFFSVR